MESQCHRQLFYLPCHSQPSPLPRSPDPKQGAGSLLPWTPQAQVLGPIASPPRCLLTAPAHPGPLPAPSRSPLPASPTPPIWTVRSWWMEGTARAPACCGRSACCSLAEQCPPWAGTSLCPFEHPASATCTFLAAPRVSTLPRGAAGQSDGHRALHSGQPR